jgi:hypothetical protein
MNCKPGDLAVVVGAYRLDGNIGGLVRVDAKYAGWDVPAWWCETLTHFKAHFEVAGVDVDIKPGTRAVVADKQLRPLRDNPWKDETLEWAGLPKQEYAKS